MKNRGVKHISMENDAVHVPFVVFLPQIAPQEAFFCFFLCFFRAFSLHSSTFLGGVQAGDAQEVSWGVMVLACLRKVEVVLGVDVIPGGGPSRVFLLLFSSKSRKKV